jgi:hypothetical protein
MEKSCTIRVAVLTKGHGAILVMSHWGWKGSKHHGTLWARDQERPSWERWLFRTAWMNQAVQIHFKERSKLEQA